MSFHPLMVYDREHFQQSERARLDEGGTFTFTAVRRAQLDHLLTQYPPDRKRSAVLAALYLVQEQEGYLTAGGMRHVAGILDMTPAEVAGLPHLVVRPRGCGARHRGALREARDQSRGDGSVGHVHAPRIRMSGRL
jgi:hypothetical protein